jgi:hypothetical protein
MPVECTGPAAEEARPGQRRPTGGSAAPEWMIRADPRCAILPPIIRSYSIGAHSLFSNHDHNFGNLVNVFTSITETATNVCPADEKQVLPEPDHCAVV